VISVKIDGQQLRHKKGAKYDGSVNNNDKNGDSHGYRIFILATKTESAESRAPMERLMWGGHCFEHLFLRQHLSTTIRFSLPLSTSTQVHKLQ
jgi:hypothetical protein